MTMIRIFTIVMTIMIMIMMISMIVCYVPEDVVDTNDRLLIAVLGIAY